MTFVLCDLGSMTSLASESSIDALMHKLQPKTGCNWTLTFQMSQIIHFQSIFVSPELSSVRDYVITHSVRSMYVVCSMYEVCM